MSAMPVPTSFPSAPADRPALRLVHDRSARPASGLAPTGPLQAWRRRIGVLIVLSALVLLGARALSGGAPTTPTVPVTSVTVVVQPGDTLWDVASRHAPADVGTASYVRELAAVNGVTNGAVDAWQVLRLPAA